MEHYVLVAATALRLVVGWYMFSQGLRKVRTQGWSAEKFLVSVKTFPSLYTWFAQPSNLVWVNPLNSWGMTFIGVALLIGVGIQPAAWAGALMMLLYYFPHVDFSNLQLVSIVDEHLIYVAIFILIALMPEAQMFGLEPLLRSLF